MLQKTSNNIFFIVGNQTVIGDCTFTHAIELTNQKVYNFGYLFIHALFTLRVNFNQKEKRYEKHSKQMD